MDSELTRQEKGKIKKYLILLFKNKDYKKEKNTLSSRTTILDLISKIEENKILSNEDIINIKINLDGASILMSKKNSQFECMISDDIIISAYEKLIYMMKAC